MAERPERRIDYYTISLYLSLIAIGWLMIYTVGYGEDYNRGLSYFLFETTVGKQTIWIGISLVLLFFIFLIDRKFWQTFSYLFYAITLGLLVAVLIFGREIKGATSWFALGGFTIQPSEFAKFATCLAVASYLSTFSTDLKQLRSQIIAIGLFAVPIFLVLLQPDAGSALVFMSFFIVLYREGFPANFYIFTLSAAALLILSLMFTAYPVIIGLIYIALMLLAANLKRPIYFMLGLTAVLAFCIFSLNLELLTIIYGAAAALAILAIYHVFKKKQRLVILSLAALALGSAIVFAADFSFNNILQPHQQDRINAWLNPDKGDRQGSLYNVVQSKIAIGSGGFYGKGFREGVLTKGKHVPEQTTDFIFCTVGEEQGFIGSFAIILFFLLLLIRITMIAERQRSAFSRCYAYGVAGILFVHFFINIGMTMGIVPIIGIPLPFISKGGSSLLGFTLLIGVLLKLDRHRFMSS